MKKCLAYILWIGYFIGLLFGNVSAQSTPIVVTGSILKQGTDIPVANARVVMQLDTVRFSAIQTDQLGFFIFTRPESNVGLVLKYFVDAPGYSPAKGSIILDAVNEPLLLELIPSAGASLETIVVEGRVMDELNNIPLKKAYVELRIGNIILPDTLSDERGWFSLALLPDDIGKVATYRILKNGYAPRYGYFTIQRLNPPLNVNLKRLSLIVSGYIREASTREPVENARILLSAMGQTPETVYTNQWGFFKHGFEKIALQDTLNYRVEKNGFQPTEGHLYPLNQETIELNLEMNSLEKRPLIKNKYLMYGSAGIAAIVTGVIIYRLAGDDRENLSDLPLPPIPPGD